MIQGGIEVSSFHPPPSITPNVHLCHLHTWCQPPEVGTEEECGESRGLDADVHGHFPPLSAALQPCSVLLSNSMSPALGWRWVALLLAAPVGKGLEISFLFKQNFSHTSCFSPPLPNIEGKQ